MNLVRIGKYTADDRMSGLIGENYFALLVLSRFGISLGFGDKTIKEVCVENQVDTDTFLAIINLMASNNQPLATEKTLSLDCLIDYLEHSHRYFLKFLLPEIRKKLLAALNDDETDLNRAVVGYFDKFAAAMKKHTVNEDKKIFPYVRSLLKGNKIESQPIVLARQHEQIELSLSEFKTILIKYYPARKANRINSFLFDIFNYEKDLASHNAVEEFLFQPAIDALAQNAVK